jgi:hypothetical protein
LRAVSFAVSPAAIKRRTSISRGVIPASGRGGARREG